MFLLFPLCSDRIGTNHVVEDGIAIRLSPPIGVFGNAINLMHGVIDRKSVV